MSGRDYARPTPRHDAVPVRAWAMTPSEARDELASLRFFVDRLHRYARNRLETQEPRPASVAGEMVAETLTRLRDDLIRHSERCTRQIDVARAMGERREERREDAA